MRNSRSTGAARRFAALLGAATGGLLAGTAAAAPTIYPTGTTIYDSARAWNGYTVFIAPDDTGGVLIDMNGEVLRTWPEFDGIAGGPVRILPGGHAMGATGRHPSHRESTAVRELDWSGEVVWAFERLVQIETDAGETWSARQHHDWQREGLPAGYYSPEADLPVAGGRTLVLAHRDAMNPDVTDRMLLDDLLVEVSSDGTITWTWLASDHVEELGFSAEARDVIRRARRALIGEGDRDDNGEIDGLTRESNSARMGFDWLHVNSATWLGPNRWYDEGDERFAPANVIISSRNANIIAIVSRSSGEIVWRLGPDYRASKAEREIGQIIGHHHAHMIPKGLPGAGNILVFDNGGGAGYGYANPAAPDGIDAVRRIYSRVVEIDPVTLEKVWEYSAESNQFFSRNVSSAQRLPNGNTMITEGADGRLFEVTVDGEIVWEYVSPYFIDQGGMRANRVYRAYRLPYDWVPQLSRPEERDVVPLDVSEFRVPSD